MKYCSILHGHVSVKINFELLILEWSVLNYLGLKPVTAKLIRVFVFAYADNRFSHNEAHMIFEAFILHSTFYLALNYNSNDYR